jgi:hypothetical protein
MYGLNFYVLRDMSTYLLLLSLTNRMRALLFSVLATADAVGTPRAGTARPMMPYVQDRRLRSNFGMKEGQAVGMQEFEDETHEASPDPPPSQHPHYFAWCVALSEPPPLPP